MMAVAESQALFSAIDAFDVHDVHGQRVSLDEMATACVDSGQCHLFHDEAGHAVLNIPIYQADQVVSVVRLATRPMLAGDDGKSAPTGALEIWKPCGDYADLGLADGFYGKLERFQNVSSFVRFESGRGLPGQVWASGRAVIHDDLANHPGFLRSAGASAESLDMAVGLPVGDSDPVSAVILISSDQTPIVDGLEIWSIEGDEFVLRESRYTDDAELSLRHQPGQTLPLQSGLAGLVLQHGGATTSTNSAILSVGGDRSVSWQSGLAIPIFIDGEPVEVVTMLLRGS